MDPEGKQWPLNTDVLAGISAIQEDYAARGQRVLLLAKKTLNRDVSEGHVDANSLEDYLLAANIDLTVVGLVALVDPPRPETEETVRVCRRAGIRFAMVTGIYLLFLPLPKFSTHLSFRRLLTDGCCNRASGWYNHHARQ
jgi:sodium/potassium-transporting ATPase subunit alpha